MTEKEYKLQCEVEKLRKENQALKNRNKDLEAQKKTLSNKFELQSEQLWKLKSESKIDEYKEIKRKYDIAMDTIRELGKQMKQKDSIIQDLKSRLNKDSTNSSKPSSTDGFKKIIHSCREKTDRKIGGQRNHKGTTLNKKEPTQIVDKKIDICECGGKVENSTNYEAKQLIDIEIKVNVIE